MPKTTIPEKWLQSASNNYTSRFEVVTDERRDYETERCQQAAECYDYETTTNKDHHLTPSQALVAQLAERLHYFVDIAVIFTGSGIVQRIKLVAFLTGGFAALSAMMRHD